MEKQLSAAEDNSSGKSSVRLTGNMETTDLKPSIITFRRLLEKHYGESLRMNEMTGRPEFYDRFENIWREWTDVQDAQLREWFQSECGLYH